MTLEEMVETCSGEELMSHPPCPKCGGVLVRSRADLWCTSIGGRDERCLYGIKTPRRVSDLHADGDQADGSGI